jgi:Flp pilus assembly protein TadG
MKLLHFIRHDDGALAVEMAFVSPFLLLLLFGIYDFGSLFVNAMEVEHATQAAASFASNQHYPAGSISLSTVQAAASASTPLAVTVATDPAPWCGCPQFVASTSAFVVQPASCSSTCTAGIGTYYSVVGSAPTQSTLGTWIGFPPTLATKILIRLN